MIQNSAQNLEKQHHFQLYKRYPITLKQGKGTKVYDTDGNEYIDALAGIAVNGTGHCHPNVVEAIKKQAETLIHCSNLYYNEPQSELAQLLTQKSGMDRAFLCNSGAEAVEAAIKLVRKYGDKQGKQGKIISFENCFHGRTLGTISMGKAKFQEGFYPLLPGFQTFPYNDAESLQKNIGPDTKAVIAEPIQGESGIIPAEKEFLQELRKICDDYEVPLIFDEIQCGLGRTGEMFAYQYYGVKPDIITIAKSMGGGYPIGAMLAKEEIAGALEFGNHGTTFGGNPLGCAAALAALKTIEEENLPEKARENGKYFMDKIKEKTEGMDQIREIRGVGLMIGVELSSKCADVVLSMLQKGVLANCAAEYVIRMLPPLIITKDEIDTIVDVMVESIKEADENG